MVAAARTPLAPAGGDLAGWHPVELVARVLDELVDRRPPGRVAEVWVGCAEPVGAQGADLARAAVVASRLADTTPGWVVDGAEASGSAALRAGAAVAATGTPVAVVGVGHASTVPPGAGALGRLYGRPWAGALEARAPGSVLPAGRLAERAARRAGLGSGDLATWARRSRSRQVASVEATRPGRLGLDARPPSLAAGRRGDPLHDDAVRPSPGPDLPPLYDDDGLLTAETVAPPGDGAAALVLAPAAPEGPEPALLAVSTTAADPFDPLGGAVGLVDGLCAATGHSPADLDAVVVAEPDAASALVLARSLAGRGVATDVLAPHGGALATAHAGAADVLARVVDALVALPPGRLVAAVDHGPTGAVVSLWRTGTLGGPGREA